MNSLATLKALKKELVAALELQQYHGLLNIDDKIKKQVSDVMLVIDKKGLSQEDKRQIKGELSDLIEIYQKVVDKCQSKSSELKQECLGLQVSKKKADQYLDVAGRL